MSHHFPLPSRAQKPWLCLSRTDLILQLTSHHREVSSHHTQLLTAVPVWLYTVSFLLLWGKLGLSDPNKLFASPSLSLPTADLHVQPCRHFLVAVPLSSASRCCSSLSCCSVINSPKHGAVADPVTFFAKAFINLTLVFIATHQGAVTNIQLYLASAGGFTCSKGCTECPRRAEV